MTLPASIFFICPKFQSVSEASSPVHCRWSSPGWVQAWWILVKGSYGQGAVWENSKANLFGVLLSHQLWSETTALWMSSSRMVWGRRGSTSSFLNHYRFLDELTQALSILNLPYHLFSFLSFAISHIFISLLNLYQMCDIKESLEIQNMNLRVRKLRRHSQGHRVKRRVLLPELLWQHFGVPIAL